VAQTEFLSPGVFGVEVAPTRAEEGISPAKMGIAGWTNRGPVNQPIEVRSVEEFSTFFGPINSMGLTAISMRAFFGTGGQRAWVVRVVPSDAVEASVDVDSPAKWTFTANGAGTWGNDLVVRIEGNRNFLDRTDGAEKWDKFDLKVLEPTSFDPSILGASETFEAIQFSDSQASDYVVSALTDPRNPSLLVDITEGAGGPPDALLRSEVTDEVIGTGDALGTTQFMGTLAMNPVLTETLRIVAADTTVDDEAQTPTPALGGVATGFTFTLPTTPVLDGSLRLFAPRYAPVINEAPTVTGVIDGANDTFTIATGGISDLVHKETDVFRLKYAATGSSSGPNTLTTIAGTPATHDLATTPITLALPVHPGTLSIDVTISAATETITDDGAGNLSGTSGSLPSGGTINYDTGEMTGVTATLDAASTVDETHNPSSIITKASTTDNLATGVALTGAVTSGTIDLVDDVDTPTSNGALSFVTSTPPETGTLFYLDFVRLMLVESDVDGNLTGDTGVGANTADFVDGDVDVEFAAPVLNAALWHDVAVGGPFTVGETVTGGSSGASATVSMVSAGRVLLGTVTGGPFTIGETITGGTSGATATVTAKSSLDNQSIDADYQAGQVATDDGLGNLVGDVDASGENTINYETGEFDLTWDTAPPDGTDILANYVKLARIVDFSLSGGSDGTAVTRAEISDPSLETNREGIYAFDDVEDPLNLVLPDFEGSLFVQADLVDYAESRNTRFAILGAANGTTKDEAIKYVLVDQAFDTKVAAFYWPNVFFVNEVSERPELIPVTPFVAGVYAKTAFNKNVGKSPGGLEDGALDANGTVGPEFGNLINDIRVRDDLYQSRINPLFNSDATGFVVWGVRSLSTEFRWRYVNARLLHNFLMDAISRQLQWAVFENNGPQLWVKIETALKGFMGSLFRQGYFAGVTEEQAFFVVANATNNNQGTVNEGKVIIDIGFSPFKPAEFIIFRLSQPASTITV